MPLTITSIHAAIINVLMAVLSTLTAMTCGKTHVALVDGGNPEMALAMRRFGNLSEYAAMAALMLLLMELVGIPPVWIHTYGIALVALRLLHPFILFNDMSAPMVKKLGRFVAGVGTAGLLLISGFVLTMLWIS